MNLIDILNTKNIERLALVGSNSQGKTYALEQLAKQTSIKGSAIFIWSEVKADDGLKNSADSTVLVSWLNKIIDMRDIKTKIDEKIEKFDFSSINKSNIISVSLKNDFNSFKGVIGADISTKSNDFGKPGSGEKFLGQLYLVSSILEKYNNNEYKYLVIDEPEQHLHPTLFIKMAMILKKISKQGIKVVISTHSPLILKYFIDDTREIVHVKNGQLNQLMCCSDYIGMRKDLNVYVDDRYMFDSYLKVSKFANRYFDLFLKECILKSVFSEVVIIGEGHIERELFSIFHEEYIGDESSGMVDSVITFGKCFIPWTLAILSSLNVKTLCLYDLDNESDSKHVNINKIILDMADETISFSLKIENRLNIDGKDKARSSIIDLREKFISRNEELLLLLHEMRTKIDKLFHQLK